MFETSFEAVQREADDKAYAAAVTSCTCLLTSRDFTDNYSALLVHIFASIK